MLGAQVFEISEARWFSPEGRAVTRIFRSEKAELLVVGWEPGQESSRHQHGDSESLVLVLEGEITVNPGTVDVRQARAGTVIATEPRSFHQLRNASDKRCLTLHFYAPSMAGAISAPLLDLSVQAYPREDKPQI